MLDKLEEVKTLWTNGEPADNHDYDRVEFTIGTDQYIYILVTSDSNYQNLSEHEKMNFHDSIKLPFNTFEEKCQLFPDVNLAVFKNMNLEFVIPIKE